MTPRACLLLAVALCLAVPALALDATLQSVEIDLVLRTDGKADVFSSIEWTATGGEMHGFIYEGFGSALPVFDRERCYADLPNGRRSALEIKDLGRGRYDVPSHPP